jgi:hypothetical protein
MELFLCYQAQMGSGPIQPCVKRQQVKGAEIEADHSSPISVKKQNAMGINSTELYILMA